MDSTITCPKCSAGFQFEKQLVPTKVSCSECEHKFIVEAREMGEGVEISGYRIVRPLGSGGMGEVFLANQLSMDREVALKILRPSAQQDPEDIEAFIREARLLAKLDHPNIVTAFDFGESLGVFYLAMAYVEGEDLADRLGREGTISEKDALEIGIKVAKGLSYAWDKHHLLHRDINPANIMMDRYGDVRIMDLGIGKTMNDESAGDVEHMLVGTPNYMSPESARGDTEIDFRADLYSLGATLHYMVTGVIPFDDDDPLVVLDSVRTDSLPPATKINPHVSAECSSIIKVMMAKARDDRFENWDVAIGKMESVLKIASKQGAPSSSVKAPPGGGRRKSSRKIAPKRTGKIPQKRRSQSVAPVKKSSGGLLWAVVVLVLIGCAGGGYYVMDQNNKIALAAEQAAEEERLEKERQEQQKSARLKNRFDTALLFLQREPPAYPKALKALIGLLPDCRNTPLEDQVQEQIALVRTLMVSDPGPKDPEVPEKLLPNAQTAAAMKVIQKGVAQHILTQDFDRARDVLADAMIKKWPIKHVAELDSLKNTVETVSAISSHVVESFQRDIGREIIVPLLGGPEKIRIVSADDEEVKGEIVLRSDGKIIGAVRRNFTASDLTLSTRSDRLGRRENVGILRAVLAYEERDIESAQSYLTKSDDPFAVILLESLNALIRSKPKTTESTGTSDAVSTVVEQGEKFMTLKPVSQARISDKSPSTALGSRSSDLSVYHFAAFEDRSLIQFDVSPVDREIVSARIILEANVSQGKNNGETMSLHAVSKAWDSKSVTWKSASKGSSWDNAGGDFGEEELAYSTDDANRGDQVVFDVTALVSSWVSGSNNGVLLRSTHKVGGNGLGFYGSPNSRSGIKGPLLEIEFK